MNKINLPFPTTPEETGPGKLIGFYSLTPGAGATTLACMVALSMQKQDTVVVDMRYRGKLRTYLGITLEINSGSVLDVASITKHAEIRNASMEHPRGIYVIPGVFRPLDAAQITTSFVSKVLIHLKNTFKHSVVILEPVWMCGWPGVLMCDSVCVVMKPCREDIDIYHEEIDLISRLGAAHRMKIIMNQANLPGGIKEKEIATMLGYDYSIPYDPRIQTSANKRHINISAKIAPLVQDIITGGCKTWI